MIGSSDSTPLSRVHLALLAALIVTTSGVYAEDLLKPPEIPKVEAPEVPELPGEADSSAQGKKKPNVPMRKVLDHKKQWVILPRVGYLKVGSTAGTLAVDHLSLGIDGQLGIKQKFYLSAEAHLLYINEGSYGITWLPGSNTLVSFPKGDFASLLGVGLGMFTHILDKQEFWTRFGVRVGYLSPFFLPIWLGGDIEKEFRRTRQSYWVVSASPAAGVLIPIRSPVGRQSYFPEPLEEGEESPMDIKYFVGAHFSLAYVFAPRS